MSLYAEKSNQYSLFGSLIATPELSTERVIISGDDKIGQMLFLGGFRKCSARAA